MRLLFGTSLGVLNYKSTYQNLRSCLHLAGKVSKLLMEGDVFAAEKLLRYVSSYDTSRLLSLKKSVKIMGHV